MTQQQSKTIESARPVIYDRARDHSEDLPPAVIIVGPPWPRSGTGRVIQNQVNYYRARGYFTVFIAVPFAWHYIRVSQNLTELMEGLKELGADRVCIATLDDRKYATAKYMASVRHVFRGTTLDWQVAIGEAARLSQCDLEFLSKLRPSVLHVNHVYTLRFALNLRRRLFDDRLPSILETHDVQSQFIQGRGEPNPWTRRPDQFERLIKSETKLLEKANVLIHLSVDDSELFQTLLPSKPHFLALPTIDEDSGSVAQSVPPLGESIDLLFVGYSNPFNLAAVKWFFEEVWPLIADRGYRVRIVGTIGSMVERELPRLYDMFRSSFVGEVADLFAYYRAARCVIAPMVWGSGISIKTIEALAVGKPFVGTGKAFRGMPMEQLKKVGIQAHDEPQGFADAIVHALGNEAAAQALSRTAYNEVFSVEANSAARDKALHAALHAAQPKSLLRRLRLL